VQDEFRNCSQVGERMKTRDLIHRYDSSVAYWDSIIHRSVYGNAYRKLFETLASRHWKEGQIYPRRVLDCGIGTGLLASSLCSLETDVELYGVDASMEMLKRARSRLLANRLHPNLAIADLVSLPFRDCEMDLVMAALVLEHVARPIDALREIARVGRPGAMILLVTTRPNAPDLPFRLAFGYKPFEKNQVLDWMTQAGIQDSYLCPLPGLAYLFAQAYIGVRAD